MRDDRFPAVPEDEHPPLPGIAILIALMLGGLTALICAGISIAGGIAAILGVFS